MEELIKAIHTTPIIDNHAHPLLKPEARGKHPLLAITTEAHGDAMGATKSALSHIRAVKQLSGILGCDENWDDVVRAIEAERQKPDDAWNKRCFQGIETVLIDDGLDGKDAVFDYAWHDRLTRSRSKRIVRVEKVAEEIIDDLLRSEQFALSQILSFALQAFDKHVIEAISDPEVVGFKSVICYRTGLDISLIVDKEIMKTKFLEHLNELQRNGVKGFEKLDGQPLNAFLVHLTAKNIQNSKSTHKKPFQFHTGLGDNDITLTRSSPAHLQEFIKRYHKVPIVLLHASYPWTREAGYLASVYDNVYADIGEVFPCLSADGQEKVVREILELVPTEKILWSTDGHWFPETYLLAVVQVREALEAVLTEYVSKEVLSSQQAIVAVENILFKTSNNLYDLKLSLKPLCLTHTVDFYNKTSQPCDLDILTTFLKIHPNTKYIQLRFLDYTSTSRTRVIPGKQALHLLEKNSKLSIGITKAALGLLQNDTVIAESSATGEYVLEAIISSVKYGPADNYASVQGEFREADGSQVKLCPRSTLRRVIAKAKRQELEFLLGFEIEIVFMSHEKGTWQIPSQFRHGHLWSSSRTLHQESTLRILDEIYERLFSAGIHLKQFHAESSDGQFEFILPALPPLEAVDTLLHAREIIMIVVARYGMRATLVPKPFPSQGGTASHAHISIVSPKGANSCTKTQIYGSFYAGILKHLQSIIAFTYSNPTSYERMADGCWAGGTWVAWGTQNRETALRKIEGSHWEIKVLDGLANTYLAMAALIAAGTKGVVKKEQLLLKDCEVDPAHLSEGNRKELNITSRLPNDLDEALGILDKDLEIRRLLGDELVDRYLAVKKGEMKSMGGLVHWERREWLISHY